MRQRGHRARIARFLRWPTMPVSWGIIVGAVVVAVAAQAAPEAATKDGRSVRYTRTEQNGRLVFRTGATAILLEVGDHVVLKHPTKLPTVRSDRGCKKCGFLCAFGNEHKVQHRDADYSKLRLELKFIDNTGSVSPLEASPWGGDLHFIAPRRGQLVPPQETSIDDIREQAKSKHDCKAEGKDWEDDTDEGPHIVVDEGEAGFELGIVVCRAGIDPAAKGCE